MPRTWTSLLLGISRTNLPFSCYQFRHFWHHHVQTKHAPLSKCRQEGQERSNAEVKTRIWYHDSNGPNMDIWGDGGRGFSAGSPILVCYLQFAAGLCNLCVLLPIAKERARCLGGFPEMRQKKRFEIENGILL